MIIQKTEWINFCFFFYIDVQATQTEYDEKQGEFH